MGKLKMENLSRMSHNWEFIQDLLYLLPFTPVDRVVKTYEEDILATLIPWRRRWRCLSGVAQPSRRSAICEYVERVWVVPRDGHRGRGQGMYSLLRWNHYYDSVTGNAVTNNSSESSKLICSWSGSLISTDEDVAHRSFIGFPDEVKNK